MNLVVFDLDGTLLNAAGRLSAFTLETLVLLREHGIPYTIATGRTLHASLPVLGTHAFPHPQAYKNGVIIWDPTPQRYTHDRFLSRDETERVIDIVTGQDLTPFIFTIESGFQHAIYHPPPKTVIEDELVRGYRSRSDLPIRPLEELSWDVSVTNVSALGEPRAIAQVSKRVLNEPSLVAYTNTAMEDAEFHWIDIHHTEASKGAAAERIRDELGASRIICFGDSMNDLSMFAIADEAYATSNGKPEALAAATATIGHHDDDAVAVFLRERFSL